MSDKDECKSANALSRRITLLISAPPGPGGRLWVQPTGVQKAVARFEANGTRLPH